MGETFLTAGTQIEALVEKKDAILDKSASLVAEAIIDRAKTANVKKSTESDLSNLLKGFDETEQNVILRKALVLVAMNAKFGSTRTSDKDSERSRDAYDRSNIFKNRSRI